MGTNGPPKARPLPIARPGAIPEPIKLERNVLEKHVAQYLYKKMKKLGGECYGWSSIHMRGVTDKICIFPPDSLHADGRICLVELKKTTKDKLSPNQVRFHARMKQLKVWHCHVLHGKKEVDLWLKSMGY
jgi:hypothetical protein